MAFRRHLWGWDLGPVFHPSIGLPVRNVDGCAPGWSTGCFRPDENGCPQPGARRQALLRRQEHLRPTRWFAVSMTDVLNVLDELAVTADTIRYLSQLPDNKDERLSGQCVVVDGLSDVPLTQQCATPRCCHGHCLATPCLVLYRLACCVPDFFSPRKQTSDPDRLAW